MTTIAEHYITAMGNHGRSLDGWRRRIIIIIIIIITVFIERKN